MVEVAGDGGVPLTRLQRVAADRLARSWAQAPHIVQMVEVDAEQLAQAAAALREGGVGTLNDLLIKAAADCLARFPALNARFAGDRLIPRGEVAVGLAVATDAGLTVPVVRGADRLDLSEIAVRTQELIAAARSGRLGGGQVGGASLTISNLGAYGIAFGTPVLNLDEPILIFVGAVEDRAVVRGGQVVVEKPPDDLEHRLRPPGGGRPGGRALLARAEDAIGDGGRTAAAAGDGARPCLGRTRVAGDLPGRRPGRPGADRPSRPGLRG